MKVSQEQLIAEAARTRFRPEILEKVIQLLHLLANLQSHPYLRHRLALKGGTALNLFIANVPRLSVDIDLNYVGAHPRETMLKERPLVERAIEAVCNREGFKVRRAPDAAEHAGGKWSLQYESASGQGGNIEIDLNYMFRVPLWPVSNMDSHRIGAWSASKIQVVDIHELAGGKLAALLSRHQARDLFDVTWLLRDVELEIEKLRIAFVVYGAMNRKDWRTVSIQDVDFGANELARQLIPVLRTESKDHHKEPADFGDHLVSECRQVLSAVLPLETGETCFLDLLLDIGEIDPSYLTSDADLQERIREQPMLRWKALNVKNHKLAK